ncbi:MAG: CinA family protein [Nitrospirota bacterium]
MEATDIVKKVHELFKNGQLTLSVAESCTGGLVCHMMTDEPGASAFFKAGIVAYADDIKKGILGVSPETIDRFGVVSRETACEMAEKVRRISNTDYSLSTTGNLGPDVLEGKARGLVYISAGREGRTISRELRLKGDRAANKKEAAVSAMGLLIEIMREEDQLQSPGDVQ